MPRWTDPILKMRKYKEEKAREKEIDRRTRLLYSKKRNEIYARSGKLTFLHTFYAFTSFRDLTQANFEMAQFNRASLKNAIVREMYVSGATLFEGIKDIEGSDWTDTYLRADQRKYLCSHPTAKGTNPVTGEATRDTLMCPDAGAARKDDSGKASKDDDALYPSF
jgi:hypothetical protein